MQGRHHGNAEHQKLYQEIKFLQVQNNRLKEELSDARDLIQMNKIQLDVLSKDKSHDKKLVDVIYNYRQKVQILQKKTSTVNQNCQKLALEKLVIQQLNQEMLSQQRSMEELHKSRVKQLTDMVKNLEEKNHICQKDHQNYDIITGFVQKSRDLLTPLEQAIQFKSKQDAWSQQISYMKDQLGEHKKNEQNLLLANGILRNKVVSLQAKLAMPNKNLGQILDKSLKRLMLYFIQTQKKMLTGDDSDSQEEDLELIAPQLIELFPVKQKNSASDFKVPGLNILKVRNHQMKGNQKIKQDLDRRNHLTQSQKIQRLGVELQFTRRSLTKHLIELKSESQRRKILQKICEQLEQRNEFLIKSNQIQRKKLQGLRKQFQANREKILSNEKFDFLDDQNEPSFIKKESHHNKNKDIQNQKLRQYEVNKYLEKIETPFQYKLHLELLAKDLDKNSKLKNIQQHKVTKDNAKKSNAQQNSSKLKRSTSNPFLYFNQRRDQIMQIQPQRQLNHESNQTNQRLEQTQYLPMGNNKFLNFNEDLDDLEDI